MAVGLCLRMSLLVRILIIAACGAAGYLGASGVAAFTKPADTPSKTATGTPAPPTKLELPTSAESALILEWEQLRGARDGATADLPAIYTAVKDIQDPFRRRAFRASITAEWAVRDPRAALAYLGEKDKGNMGQLIREWLRLDPQAAVSHLLTDEKTRGQLRNVLSEIARVAPARLAEVVSVLPKAESRWDTTAQDAFAIFAAKDPEAARAAAESITGVLRGQALAGVARTWAESDGAAALTWAQGLQEGEARDAALKGALIGWAKNDPSAALNHLDVVPPGGEEMYHASDVGAQVLRAAAKRDWEGTVAWLREHPGKLGRSSLDGLQTALSERLNIDPAGTMRSLEQSGVPALTQVLANAFLNDGYAQRDTIWAWLDQQPAREFTMGVRSSLINAIAWKEPNAALEYLEKLPDTPANRQIFETGTRSLINGGSQMHRFEELFENASPTLRPYLIETGFMYGADAIGADPQRWLARLDELPTDKRSNAVGGIARGLAANDPQAAADWALSLKDPIQGQQALSQVCMTWAGSDVYEAANWIGSLPEGVNRDTATRGLVNALSFSEPETAWTWALSINSQEYRLSALQLAYMGLEKKDPKIAQQLLQSTPFTPEESNMIARKNVLMPPR